MTRLDYWAMELRLRHQNDPALYHETIQMEARCHFCGHRRGPATRYREAWDAEQYPVRRSPMVKPDLSFGERWAPVVIALVAVLLIAWLAASPR